MATADQLPNTPEEAAVPEKALPEETRKVFSIATQDLLDPNYHIFPYAAVSGKDGKLWGLLGRGITVEGNPLGIALMEGEAHPPFDESTDITLDLLPKIEIDRESLTADLDIWAVDGDEFFPSRGIPKSHKKVTALPDKGDVVHEDGKNKLILSLDELVEAAANAKEIELPAEPYRTGSEAVYLNTKQESLVFTQMGNKLLVFLQDVMGSSQMSKSHFVNWANNLLDIWDNFADNPLPIDTESVDPSSDGYLIQFRRVVENVLAAAKPRIASSSEADLAKIRFNRNTPVSEIANLFALRRKAYAPVSEVTKPIPPEIKKRETKEHPEVHNFVFADRLPTEVKKMDFPYGVDVNGDLVKFGQSYNYTGPYRLNNKAKVPLAVSGDGDACYYMDDYGHLRLYDRYKGVEDKSSDYYSSMQVATRTGDDIVSYLESSTSKYIGVYKTNKGKWSTAIIDDEILGLHAVGQNTFAGNTRSGTRFFRFEDIGASVRVHADEFNKGFFIEESAAIPGGLTALTVRGPNDEITVEFYNSASRYSAKKINLGKTNFRPKFTVQGNTIAGVFVSNPAVLMEGQIATFNYREFFENPSVSKTFTMDNLPGAVVTEMNNNETLKEGFSNSTTQSVHLFPFGKDRIRFILGRAMIDLKV
jgi:hypothetical protein